MCALGTHLMYFSHMCSTSKDLTKVVNSITPKAHTFWVLCPNCFSVQNYFLQSVSLAGVDTTLMAPRERLITTHSEAEALTRGHHLCTPTHSS